MTREDKKREAIRRMKLLKLHKNAIEEFRNKDKLNVSENAGALYWATDSQISAVKDFEEKHNAVVYHLIRSIVGGEEHIAYLYVSDYEEEWEMDINDIKQGRSLAYVKNVDCDWCSEFGTIGIKPSFGGVIRTA